MPAFKKLCLAATLAALAAPVLAAPTFIASGSYNLGAGNVAVTPTSCGDGPAGSGGQDVLDFPGIGVNNVGLHAYACQYNGITSFGSRASGENTYSVKSIGGLSGSITTSDGDGFSFYVSPGEVGAFGANFAAGEYQKASLTIKLEIDGITYMDLAWSAEVGAGGAVTHSYTAAPGSRSFAVAEAGGNPGDTYFSYGLAGGMFNINAADGLTDGDHTISYLMTAEASGLVSSTSVCSAVLYPEKAGGGEARFVAEAPQQGAPAPFTSYCGAGARTGDPLNFNANDPFGPFGSDPIARAQEVVNDLPEPMTAGLTLTALLAAVAARRRAKR